MFRKIIRLTLLLGIFGCGTMFDSTGSSGSRDKITIPKEISVKIPEILKNSKNKRVEKIEKESVEQNISQGYNRLKGNIEEIVWSQKMMEINLLFIEEVIGEIDRRCKKTALDKLCIIESGELSFAFNDNFFIELSSIVNEEIDDSLYELKDKIIFLGEVKFTQYSKNENYQYNLKIDTSPLSKLLGDDETSIQILKWSKDENRVFSYFSDESNSQKSDFGINYFKKDSGEKEMFVDSSFTSKVNIDRGKFHLKIIEKNDKDETFEITSKLESKEEYEGEIYYDNSSSIGEISNQGGFLSISGNFRGEISKEKYLFDGNGEIISSRYCEESLVCDLNDDSTWLDMNTIEFTQGVKLIGTVGGLKNSTR
ncbi:hypothetical protein GSY74_10700, partial [Sulfurovum sp. bin170]|uniref:hypothetical protein n=1 Tax=Sulfurovum sp. bin170 TaxID=2695268 RepID=UPI0013DEF8FD